MTQPVLGILTLYLNDAGALEERSYYEKLTREGRSLGIDVIVFTPEDVDFQTDQVRAQAYVPETGAWKRISAALPRMVFDRCRRQRSRRYERLLHFRSRYKHLTYLNRPLRNKWAVYNLLSKDSRYKQYLPQTRYVESAGDVRAMLQTYPLVYLKPIAGTGGRGILRIEKTASGELLVQGRDLSRRIIPPRKLRMEGLNGYIARLSRKSVRYIVQQGIGLKLSNGRVHDYRMLVQKNGAGEWKVTGCAGRIGAAGSITANLHGGGRAVRMNDLLKQWLRDQRRVAYVKQEAEQFGVGLASYLELCCGALCELAVDFAVDRNGRIWLIEVNPKPAREVFRQAGEQDVYRNAIARPLEYALWLWKSALQDKKNTAGGSIRTDGSLSESTDAAAPEIRTAVSDPAGAAPRPGPASQIVPVRRNCRPSGRTPPSAR